MIFYGNIQIPRISGNFDACADSVYQALFPRKKGSVGSRLLQLVHVHVPFPEIPQHPCTHVPDLKETIYINGCNFHPGWAPTCE